MKVALANDHAGAPMRQAVIASLRRAGHEVIDFGTTGPDSVDYPDYAKKAAKAVADGQADRAVLICGTGIGMSIAANKLRGIRCALCYDPASAEMARKHNDANILALRGRNADAETTDKIVETFMSTDFESGRHQRRLDKIGQLESER